MKHSNVFIAFAVAFGLAAPVIASTEQCDTVLIPSTFNESISDVQEAAFYEIISSQEEYDKAKSSGFEGAFKLISASLSFEDYQNRRKQFFQQTNWATSSDHARRTVTSALSPEVVQAWSNCMANQQSQGVMVYAKDLTPDSLVVHIRWTSLTGQTGHLPIGAIQISGSSTTEEDISKLLPKEFLSSADFEIIFDRKDTSEFRFVLNVGGTSDSIYIPPFIDPPKFSQQYLSDLPIIKERDISGGVVNDATNWNGPIVINSTNYSKGVFMHAPKPGSTGYVEYSLPHGAKIFSADIGMADHPSCTGSPYKASMRISLQPGDKEILHAKDLSFGAARQVSLEVAGYNSIVFEPDSYDGTYNCDHVVLGNAIFR